MDCFVYRSDVDPIRRTKISTPLGLFTISTCDLPVYCVHGYDRGNARGHLDLVSRGRR